LRKRKKKDLVYKLTEEEEKEGPLPPGKGQHPEAQHDAFIGHTKQ